MQSLHAQPPKIFNPAQRRALAEAYRILLQEAERAEQEERLAEDMQNAAPARTALSNSN